jgi:PAS domain S-box-containing protein
MNRAQLQRLRDQLRELQGLADDSPGGTSATLPGILTAMQRSLARAQLDGAAPPSASGSLPTPSAQARPSPLRAAAERVPLLVRAMGRDTHCRWANSAWTAFTGRTLERTLRDGWLQDVHADDRARCAQGAAGASDGPDFRQLEYRLRRADGDFAWVHEHRIPRLRARGGGVGYLATAVDVSSRKQAELHLELVHETERMLAQSATIGEDAAAVLALLCRGLEWDVGELWSCPLAQEQPRCLKRWSSDENGLQAATGQTPDTAAPEGCADPVWVADIAADSNFAGSLGAGARALHGMLQVPVPMLGGGQANLRLFSRRVRARDEAEIAVVANVAARLGHALARLRASA